MKLLIIEVFCWRLCLCWVFFKVFYFFKYIYIFFVNRSPCIHRRTGFERIQQKVLLFIHLVYTVCMWGRSEQVLCKHSNAPTYLTWNNTKNSMISWKKVCIGKQWLVCEYQITSCSPKNNATCSFYSFVEVQKMWAKNSWIKCLFNMEAVEFYSDL